MQNLLKIVVKNPGPAAQNVFTAVVLSAFIIIAVTIFYIAQTIFFRQNTPAKSALALHKINGFTTDDVFDLSGSEASGYGDPMKLFDENADPANGILTNPSTDPLPNHNQEIFFPPGRGLRIVIDLHNV
jgi:hypothetical protein